MNLQDQNAEAVNRNDLTEKVYNHLKGPQVLSNVVNNVFKPHGSVLSKFSTSASGSLQFVAQCGNVVALNKIGKSIKDNTLAEQLERAVITEEVLGQENVSHISVTTKTDEEAYKEAQENLKKQGKLLFS